MVLVMLRVQRMSGSAPGRSTWRCVRTRLEGILIGDTDAAPAVRPRLVVLAVQPLDQISAGPPAVIIRVMPVAQHELTARGGMVPDAPASRLVTVEFLDQLIDPCADRPEDTDLGEV